MVSQRVLVPNLVADFAHSPEPKVIVERVLKLVVERGVSAVCVAKHVHPLSWSRTSMRAEHYGRHPRR